MWIAGRRLALSTVDGDALTSSVVACSSSSPVACRSFSAVTVARGRQRGGTVATKAVRVAAARPVRAAGA